MNEIKHWWNVSKHFTKIDGEAANYFSMYYIQRCKQLSTELELPKQHFGPSIMCSHCGSLWSKNKSQIRISPGKACSKSVKQIIRSCTEYNTISRFRATLMKKSLKNKMNKIIIKCSVCSKNTVVESNKPKHLKPQIKECDQADVSISQKKKNKKKRVKDKTAGLNISNIQSPATDKKEIASMHSTPTVIKVKPKEKELTPLQKIKKLNLNKLNNVLNRNKSNKPRNSIHNFLKELY